jgi:hypothetical protein
MREVLPEEAQERDTQRATVLGLAGFSFTAVAGLAVLDASARPGLQLSVWYVLVSFIAYVVALNLQTYKAKRWHDHLATALMEAGALSLMLTLISLLFGAKFEPWFPYLAGALAIGAWLIDHCVRLWMENQYFRERDARLRRRTVKMATKKAGAKKSAAKKTPARRPAAKKATAKKVVAKKTTAKRSAAKKSAARRPAAKKSAGGTYMASRGAIGALLLCAVHGVRYPRGESCPRCP